MKYALWLPDDIFKPPASFRNITNQPNEMDQSDPRILLHSTF